MNTKYIIGIVVVLAIIVLGGLSVAINGNGTEEIVDGESAMEEKEKSPPPIPTPEEELKSEPVTEEEPAAPQQITVVYTNSGFNPVSITIGRGQTVTWVNENSRSVWVASAFHPTHTVYPEKKSSDCLGSAFDACRGVPTGESWGFTFDSSGSWKYHNHLSPFNTGVVIVE